MNVTGEISAPNACEGIIKIKRNKGAKWSTPEDEWLKANYSKIGLSECVKHLNRTKGAIFCRAKLFKLRVMEGWKEEEDKFLIDNYNYLSIEECISFLCGRSKPAIRGRASVLGIAKPNTIWNEKEENFLKNHFQNLTVIELSKCLYKSKEQISLKCNWMGLCKTNYWTPEDEQFVFDNYKKIPVNEIAILLNRTKQSIQGKFNRLIKQERTVTRLSIEEKEIISEEYSKGVSIAELSKQMSLSYGKITKFLNASGQIRTREETYALKRDIQFMGKKFGKLTVIKYVGMVKKCSTWLCDCDCGGKKEAAGRHLSTGVTRTCGCGYKASETEAWMGFGEISLSYFGTIKKGAKERNLSFNITIEYIWELFVKQERKCALSGTDLNFKSCSGASDGTASLDRIDSEIGYEIGNVRWVHKHINLIRWDFNDIEFLSIIKNVYEFNNLHDRVNVVNWTLI